MGTMDLKKGIVCWVLNIPIRCQGPSKHLIEKDTKEEGSDGAKCTDPADGLWFCLLRALVQVSHDSVLF